MTRILALLALLIASGAAAQEAPTTDPVDVSPHRLFLLPTARPIASGHVNAALTEVLIPNVSGGLGGRVSVMAGAAFLPEIFGSGWDIAPVGEVKASVYSAEGVHVAIGTQAWLNDMGRDGFELMPYAVATLGSANRAVTFGAGMRIQRNKEFRHYEDDLGTERTRLLPAPTLALAAERRVSRRIKLIAESTLIPAADVTQSASGAQSESVIYRYDAIVAGGIRILMKGAALDLGVVGGGVLAEWGDLQAYPRSTYGVEPGPWLNLTVGL